MKSKFRKICSSVLAFVLCFCMMLPAMDLNLAKADETYTFNASEIAAGDITELTTFGYFSVSANADNKVTVDSNSKTGDNGMEFTQRLKFGGGGSLEYRNMFFTTKGAATITVQALSSSSSADRPLLLMGTDGVEISRGTAYGTVVDGAIKSITYEVTEAGTYYLWSESGGINIYYIEVVEKAAPAAEAASAIMNVSELADATITEFTSFGDFNVAATVEKNVVIDGSAKVGDNGMEFSKRLKFGGTGSLEYRNISFKTTGEAKVTVYAMSSSSSADRNLLLAGADGTVVGTGVAYGAPADGIIPAITYDVANAGTYYLWSESSGINVYYVEVAQGGGASEAPQRAAWSTVTAPVLGTPEVSGGTIKVPYTMLIGPSTDGCDRLYVYMYDAAGNEIAKVTEAAQTTGDYAEFTPSASGDYTFKAEAARTDEETTIAANTVEYKGFVLPLEAPFISSATSQGNGKVSLVWSEVPEAEKYLVTYAVAGTNEFKEAGTISATTAIVSGLTVDTRYVFEVKAMRGADLSAAGSMEATATADEKRTWSFSAFGQGVNTTDNYAVGNINDGPVTIASVNGKGKIVPATTDGLAFYYTEIDAAKENFVLEGTIHVDSWNLSNGQDGFGIMAADAVGANGDATAFWNNSYMGIISKVEYKYDPETMVLLDSKAEGTKITMKLGIGAQEKLGATAENIADGSIETNVNELFKSTMYPLETGRIGYTAGTYNLVGNYTNNPAKMTGTYLNPLVDFKFRLERDNTGYTITWIDQYGEEHSKLYYDTERTNLTQIDKDKIYVGFFASRNATITVSDVKLTVSNPNEDAAAAEREYTKKALVSKFVSAAKTGYSDYEVIYYANADGTVKITNTRTNEVVADGYKVTADTYNYFKSKLEKGYNSFMVEFTPDADFKFDEYEILESYETQKEPFGVTHKTIGTDTAIYVTNLADATGKGTKASPVDIDTALSYAVAGQTILLGGGEYLMETTLTVERGNSGTADKMIYLIADPDAKERPVLDFQKLYRGIVFAGDYWYIAGFDVKNTKNAEKGIQLSGDHCVLDSCNTYDNGNTGIQISRYTSEDYYQDWPSYNLVLNCTSYNNADAGYEDADGFAAKLTIGDGNVFDGCIAYNNADDGWDLFAKLESGPIGKVVIKNCITYGNGYLTDGTVAGNGNGFKLGGEGITGPHELINCIAFNNKTKGIDSNHGPDVKIINCISFNNENSNVALFTDKNANTDYSVSGLVSFRTEHKDVAENIKPKGTQDTTKIYGTNNYYWSGAGATNTVGVAVTADWFKSLEFDASKGFSRNADGTINLGGFLEMTGNAPSDVGARITGQASAVLSDIKAKNVVEPTPTPTPTKAPTATPTVDPANPTEPTEPVDAEPGMSTTVIIIIVAIVVVAAVAIVALVLFSKKKKR